MTSDDLPADESLERLFAHTEFLRRLVRSLVHYEHRVDDVLQQVWLRAIRHAPRHDQKLRCWLAVVARCVVARQAKEDQRAQRALEPAVDHAPSTHDLVVQLEAQRVIREAVLELEEPVRACILLRYYEKLKTGAIATRLRISPRQVRERLDEGHESIRRKLDRLYARGDDRWCAGFAVLLAPDDSMRSGAALTASRRLAERPLLAALGLAAAVLLMATRWWGAAPKPVASPDAARLASQEIAAAVDVVRSIVAQAAPVEPAASDEPGPPVADARPSLAAELRRALANFREVDAPRIDFAALNDLLEHAGARLAAEPFQFHDEGRYQRWTALLRDERIWISLQRQRVADDDETLGLIVEPWDSFELEAPFTARGTKLEIYAHRLPQGKILLSGLVSSQPRYVKPVLRDQGELRSGCRFLLDDDSHLRVGPIVFQGGETNVHMRAASGASTSAGLKTANRGWQALLATVAKLETETPDCAPVPDLADQFQQAIEQTRDQRSLAWLCDLVAIVDRLPAPEEPVAYVQRGELWHLLPTGAGDPTVLVSRLACHGHDDVRLKVCRTEILTTSTGGQEAREVESFYMLSCEDGGARSFVGHVITGMVNGVDRTCVFRLQSDGAGSLSPWGAMVRSPDAEQARDIPISLAAGPMRELSVMIGDLLPR